MRKINTLSIVIPTMNSANEILRLLMSIMKYDIQKKAEIIIVDSNSTDDTKNILKTFPYENYTKQIIKNYEFIKEVDLDFCSKGKARNEGIKKATGNVIVNLDSDVEILDGWFEALEWSMERYDIVAGYSPDPNNKQLPRIPMWIDGQDITFPTCNIAYKRSVFDKVGLFNEQQDMAEDCELNYRCVKAGFKIIYNVDMKVYHHQRETKKGFRKQAFINGKARRLLKELHPDIKVFGRWI